jgi:bifunctional non-homologous end joining protein LigD
MAFPTPGHEDTSVAPLLFCGLAHWSDRYPWIVETARKLKQDQFVLDGEAVLLNVDGMSDFAALHSRRHDDEVQLYAFDMLAGDGDDYRRLPLSLRKTNLARLLARHSDGIYAAPYEQGEIGSDLFRHARIMGLEGLVSKHAPTQLFTARPRGALPGAELKRLPMTTRIADEFSFIRQRLDEIEGKGKPPLGKLGKKPDTPNCDHCGGRGYLVSSGPSERRKVSCPYCDPRF